MTKREIALNKAKVAGYHCDTESFTRLRIESRVSYMALLEGWNAGVRAKKNGVPCTCSNCAN